MERREYHYGDGSFKRRESEEEYRKRREAKAAGERAEELAREYYDEGDDCEGDDE